MTSLFMPIFGHACRPSQKWLYYHSGATQAYQSFRYTRKQFKVPLIHFNNSGKKLLCFLSRKRRNPNLDYLHRLCCMLVATLFTVIFQFLPTKYFCLPLPAPTGRSVFSPGLGCSRFLLSAGRLLQRLVASALGSSQRVCSHSTHPSVQHTTRCDSHRREQIDQLWTRL